MAAQPPPTSNGYYGKLKCKFLEDVSDFKCCHCQRVTKNAVQTNCCGKNYCGECITDTKPCPDCSLPPSEYKVVPDQKQKRKVTELKVACIGNLCKWEGPLGVYTEHREKCPKMKVKCPFPTCKARILRQSVEKHKEACLKRPYECPHCRDYKDTYENIQKHIPVCAFAPHACPNICGVQTLLGNSALQEHIGVCPKQPVDCDYKRFGCVGLVARAEKPVHLKQQVHEHLAMVVKMLDSNSAEIDTMTSSVLKLPFSIEGYSSLVQDRKPWNKIPTLVLQKNYKLNVTILFMQDGLYVNVQAASVNESDGVTLAWPFECTLNFTIMNPRSDGDITPNLSRSFNLAVHKLQTLHYLIATHAETQRYLKNDNLLLQLRVEDTNTMPA